MKTSEGITQNHEESNVASLVQPEGFSKKFDVVSCYLEYEGRILLLHRDTKKPQGDTWCLPGGKAEEGEDLGAALVRETQEETGVDLGGYEINFLEPVYVRYPGFDYEYRIARIAITDLPGIQLNPGEHTEYQWITPKEALELDLIPGEAFCMRHFYNF